MPSRPTPIAASTQDPCVTRDPQRPSGEARTDASQPNTPWGPWIADDLMGPDPIEVDRHNFDLAYKIFTYGIGLVALGGVVFAVVVR